MRIILTLLITCLGAIETVRADYQATTLVTGLNYPWSMVQVAPSSGLIATRAGDLLLMDLNTGATTPVSGGPATYVASQGDILILACTPNSQRISASILRSQTERLMQTAQPSIRAR